MTGCVTTCTCNASMSNTGTACTPIVEVIKKLVAVQIYDSTGTRNSIDVGAGHATINAALFSALVNQADKSKRWYPLPEMKNIDDKREDPQYEDFADGSKSFVRDGTRSFEGVIVGKEGSAILAGKIESFRCVEMGFYGIDRKGNLIGIISDDGTKLYPFRIDQESLSSMVIKTTDTTSQKLRVRFNFSTDESDNCIRMIAQTEMGGANLLTLRGLLSVYATYSAITTTGFDVLLYNDYGTPLNPDTIQGMVTADFVSSDSATASKVYNVTQNTDVTVTVTESPTVPGKYSVAFAAQTTADVLEPLLKHDGYDFISMLSDDEVAIP